MSTLVSDNYPTICKILNTEVLHNGSLYVEEIHKFRTMDDRGPVFYWKIICNRRGSETVGMDRVTFRTEPEPTGQFPTQAVAAKLRLLA